jgi:hypothetical protein
VGLPSYIRVSPGRVVSLRAAPQGVSGRPGQPLARVFLEVTEVFPVGAPIELEFKVPERPQLYRAQGVVQVVSDGTDGHLPRGLGVHLFEVAPVEPPAEPPAGEAEPPPAEGKEELRPLPTLQAVTTMLGELLGTEVTAEDATSEEAHAWEGGTVACYRDDQDHLAAGLLAELTLIASAGAALTMVPSSAVEAALKEGALPEELHENFREILNVMAALFQSPGAPRIRLGRVLPWPPPVDAEEGALLDGARRHLDLRLKVGTYPKGLLSLVLPGQSTKVDPSRS